MLKSVDVVNNVEAVVKLLLILHQIFTCNKTFNDILHQVFAFFSVSSINQHYVIF